MRLASPTRMARSSLPAIAKTAPRPPRSATRSPPHRSSTACLPAILPPARPGVNPGPLAAAGGQRRVRGRSGSRTAVSGDVLLRHRLLRQPGGFEGLGVGEAPARILAVPLPLDLLARVLGSPPSGPIGSTQSSWTTITGHGACLRTAFDVLPSSLARSPFSPREPTTIAATSRSRASPTIASAT
jgi:hypothetical protein